MHANQYLPRLTTKSPVKLAQISLEAAKRALPKRAAGARHEFAPAQLFTVLVLKAFLKVDYRGIIQILRDWAELREIIGFRESLPHYSTLCYAEKRLLKGGPSQLFKKPFLIEPGIWILFDPIQKSDKVSSIPREWKAAMFPITTLASG